MMAWIESHQELAQHRKTLRLSRLLGVSIPAVIGHLHLLWWWALDNAEDGDLASAGHPADVSRMSMWDGDPQAFWDALVLSGFIDADGKIHDWYEYAGKLIERRKADAERKRASRRGDPSFISEHPQDIRRTSSGHPADVLRNSTVPRSNSKAAAVVDRQPLDPDWRAAAAAAVGGRALSAVEVTALRAQERAGVSLSALTWALARAKERVKRPNAVITYAMTCIADAPKDTRHDDSPGLDAYPTAEELDRFNAEWDRIHYPDPNPGGTVPPAPAPDAPLADGPGDGTVARPRPAGGPGRLPAHRHAGQLP